MTVKKVAHAAAASHAGAAVPQSEKRAASAAGRRRSAPPEPLVRRDAVGHMGRAYATDLAAISRKNAVHDAAPFIERAYTDDDFAEQLGEQAIETATSGEDHALERFDDNAPEETVNPFRMADAGDDEKEEEE